MKATGTDSLSDCISTAVVLIATLIGHFSGLQIDGYCGIAVACLIFWAGIGAAKDTLNPLLGQPPEKEFVDKIEEIVLNFDEMVIGIHDLIVHDYGPGRQFVSLHAEVPAEEDLLKIHDVVDNLEIKLQKELGCMTTIHMDPVVTTDERVNHLKSECQEILAEINDILSLHDFRVVFGDTHTNLIFDIVIPHKFVMSNSETIKLIQSKIRDRFGEHYFAVIMVDNPTV